MILLTVDEITFSIISLLRKLVEVMVFETRAY